MWEYHPFRGALTPLIGVPTLDFMYTLDGQMMGASAALAAAGRTADAERVVCCATFIREAWAGVDTYASLGDALRAIAERPGGSFALARPEPSLRSAGAPRPPSHIGSGSYVWWHPPHHLRWVPRCVGGGPPTDNVPPPTTR